MVTIVDYGLGNLGSIQNMLKRIGIKSVITDDLKKILKAQKIILPGVGHFDRAMKNITERGLKKVLDIKALDEKIPILGICLGMQILTEGSEEGKLPGLGWIPAKTIKFHFPDYAKNKVPHMGWNIVKRARKSEITKAFEKEYRFYFVHSFHVSVRDEKYSILKTKHGYLFDSGIQHKNIFGVQFHPEKSHRFGMKLLKNFAEV